MQKYFDYAATTPCHPDVVTAMQPYWNRVFGNPNSRSHKFGWEAESAIEEARNIIANVINAQSNEIVFTSGATEANNLAIKGFVESPSYNGKTIACFIIEHKCLIETFRYLKEYKNIPIDFIPVLPSGLVNMEYLLQNIQNYALVSVGYVNNETGVKQNISIISKLCREYGVKLHTDAAQAFGKIPIDAREVDLMSISAHKIYGPKGIGALYVSKNPRVRIKALLHGGGQENNLRSGTLSTPLCVGFGKATAIAIENMQKNSEKYKVFHHFLIENIVKTIPEISVNGTLESKLPNILNLSIPYVEGESLMMRLNKFALSSGSACASKTLEPSYVISAMNPETSELAHSSLRISFGIYNTMEAVQELAHDLKKHIFELRELSPLWSMVKKGKDLKSIKWQK